MRIAYPTTNSARHPAFRALTAAVTLALSAMPLTAAAAAPQPEFGGQDVQRLATSHHELTDCSVTWTDHDGKLYCFKDAHNKQQFLQNPTLNLQRAEDFIAASDIQSTEQAMQAYDSSDAETLVNAHIKQMMAANGGTFPLQDPRDGKELELAFDGIDFTRTIDGYGFFPDVKFHDAKAPKQKYLIDFWVTPRHGQLVIQETRIYSSPEKEDGEWKTVERQPIPWWWIPAQEHPGKVAQKRGWQIMSAVEGAATDQSKKGGGIFKIKDQKTGKTLDLVFIDTHQPVRQLDSNGHYFACTDFRDAKDKHKIYDIDFWMDEQKDGSMKLTQVKVHKVPELKDGHWIEVPRYTFKQLGDSHVVP